MDIVNITSQLTFAYKGVLSLFPLFVQTFLNFFFLALLIFIYAVFIWKLHYIISKKNVLDLDLNKYNTTDHPTASKLLAVIFYFLEYIIILPLLILFWFAVLGLSLTIFTDLEVRTILVVSAVTVAAIRMTAYANEVTAKELAKLLPLNLLAISLLVPGFFDFERMLNNISQVPGFFNQIFYYLGFIIGVEIILRLFEFAFSIFSSESEEIIKRKKSED